MKKRSVLSVILACLLVFCLIPTGIEPVYAETTEGQVFTGKDCTSSKTAASIIDYAMSKYPQGSVYPGPGECWGFAEKISTMLSASRSTKYYKLKFNKKNFKKKCLNVKAGTHLRMTGTRSSHSVVLLKVTKKKVIWADNNLGWDNKVRYHSGTLDDFVNYYGYDYITMISKPIKYKTHKTPQIVSRLDGKKGGIKLSWTKTSNTKKYKVYRSYSKNGKYKRIATVTGTSYTDKKVKLGKKAYYKVKAVKKSGSSAWSGKAGRVAKLAAPELRTDFSFSGLVLKWDKVYRADRYRIFKKNKKGKYVRVITTTKLSWTDHKATNGLYEYRIRAVYDKNSKANSPYSYGDGVIYIW